MQKLKPTLRKTLRKTSDPKNLIIMLFEQFMDWHVPSPVVHTDGANDSKYGMAFMLDLYCENHGYEKDGNTHHPEWKRNYRKNIHVIILRPRMVFIAVTDETHLELVPPSEFNNTSNHDSCWRTDGLRLLREESWRAYNHCYDHMPEEHKPLIGLSTLDMDIAQVFGKPMRFVRVEHKPLNDDSYHRELTEIKEAPYELRVSQPTK
jgi:hypothetical protein